MHFTIKRMLLIKCMFPSCYCTTLILLSTFIRKYTCDCKSLVLSEVTRVVRRAVQHERTMVTRNQLTLEGHPVSYSQTRKSYTREYKLGLVCFYRKNNQCQTAKRFSLYTKTIRRWVADEEKSRRARRRLSV